VRLLLLSHYPPIRGGISAYAQQLVVALRSDGHDVVVASPERSDAELVLDICDRGAGVRLVRLVRRFDRLIVQFQPEMLGAPSAPRRSQVKALLRLAAGMRAARSCDLYVHEVGYGRGVLAPVWRAVLGRVFRLADVLTVHTEVERSNLAAAFGISTDRIRVVSQGAHMMRRTQRDQATARVALDLPEDQALLLAIGHLQPHKGFDRAIRAFAGLRPERVRLYVVGSIRSQDQISLSHVEELRRLARETPGVELREAYVSDVDFDDWIVAADALVLPYRHGVSSNVMERGLLYGKPVIMSRVGGMVDQGADRAHVTLVDGDDELLEAVRGTVDEVLATRRGSTR
jgi:glycosyltransferase involved in cell wall biosynthesis